MDEFFNSEQNLNIFPVDGAVAAIESLQDCELFAITIRPQSWRKQTEEWLRLNFGNSISELYMLGVEGSSLGGTKISKGDLAKEIDLKVFIEDSLSNAIEIASKGTSVVLLDKVWNQGDIPSNVYRVNSWAEAIDKVRLITN